jgi:prepilin-type N-terminal cleavage/methylation domain-containing protein
MPANRDMGFTLIEMVIAISLTGLVAVLMTLMSSRHIEGYLNAQRRAELASDAGFVLERLRRDLRDAQSGSIVTGDNFLEFRKSGADASTRFSCEERVLFSGNDRLLEQLQSCRFHFRPAKNGSQAIVTVSFSMGEKGESVALLDQFAISSSP